MKFKIFPILVILILTLPSVLAIELDDPESCEDVDFYRPVSWIKCWIDRTYQRNVETLFTPLDQLTEGFGELMTMEISFSTISNYWAKMNYLASALLVVVIIYTGYLWIFSSIDIEKKNIAKQQTINIVYILIFVNLTLVFGVLLFNFANNITAYLWESFLNESITDFTLTEMIITGVENLLLSVLYIIVLLFVGIPFFIKIISRLLFSLVFIVLSPFIVILYFFTPTQHIGGKLGRLWLINIFFPFIWMLVFAMGKVVIVVLVAMHLPIPQTLLTFLVFTATLWLNNRLYKSLALNFDLATPITETYKTVKTVYKQTPKTFRDGIKQAKGRIIDQYNSMKDVSYKDFRSPFDFMDKKG